MLTLSALLLGITVVGPSAPPPAPASASDTIAPAFDAPPSDPLARGRSEVRDPFANRTVVATRRPLAKRSDLRDPFSVDPHTRKPPVPARATASTDRSNGLKAPFNSAG